MYAFASVIITVFVVFPYFFFFCSLQIMSSKKVYFFIRRLSFDVNICIKNSNKNVVNEEKKKMQNQETKKKKKYNKTLCLYVRIVFNC